MSGKLGSLGAYGTGVPEMVGQVASWERSGVGDPGSGVGRRAPGEAFVVVGRRRSHIPFSPVDVWPSSSNLICSCEARAQDDCIASAASFSSRIPLPPFIQCSPVPSFLRNGVGAGMRIAAETKPGERRWRFCNTAMWRLTPETGGLRPRLSAGMPFFQTGGVFAMGLSAMSYRRFCVRLHIMSTDFTALGTGGGRQS